MRVRFLLQAALAALAAATACAVSGSHPALRGGFPTAEAAAEAVLEGLRQRDTARLAALAIDEQEFRALVWPHLPAGRPDVGMPVEYVWTDTWTKSQAHLGRTLAEYGGTRLALEALAFRGPVSDYGAFRVHRETWLTLRDASGVRHERQLFGSMIASTDGWKIYSYITD